MIKKTLVFIALFLGLFLMNCSNSSSDDPEPPSSSSSSSDGTPSSVDASSSSSDGTPSSVDASSSSSDGASSSSSSQVVPSSSSDGAPSSPSSSSSQMRAEPVAAVPANSEPDILYSWTDRNKNYYIINVGYIKNSLLMEKGFYYSGVGYMGISTTTTTENSIAENRTNTVSNSVVVKTGQQTIIGLKEAITTGVKTGVEAGVEANGIFVKGSVKASVEATIEGSVEKSTETSSQISNSFETSTGRTTETSESFETTIKQSWSNSTSLAANSGDPAGYYRYAWYVVSDVYFIISTSLDNQELLSWEVVSIPREKYELHQEYSLEIFDNSPIDGTEIVFAEGFYKTLQKPTKVILPQYTLTTNATEGGGVSRSPNQITYEPGTQVTVTATPDAGYVFNGWTGAPSGINASNASITFAINSNTILTANFRRAVEKTEIKEFTTAGNHTYTFDKGFPATIEVYAIGAGGGGQGGHENGWMGDGGKDGAGHERGTGGAGGGGAAAYIKYNLEQSTIITIKVGKGGTYGSGSNKAHWLPINKDGNWTSGTPGSDGENTTVQVGSTILTANGGKGGGGAERTEIHGGNGGTASKPSEVPEANWATTPGNKGTDGIRNGNQASIGGNSGRLIVGSSDIGGIRGGGGASSYGNNIGSVGLDGEVKIVVTYYE